MQNPIKKLDFNIFLKDLDGQDLLNEHMGKQFARILSMQTKGDPLKFMSWALQLQQSKPLELDLSDLDTLKNFIITNEQMTNLMKFQLLNIINATAREKADQEMKAANGKTN